MSENGIRPEVQAAMNEVESKVMKPYNAMLQKCVNGWVKLATPNESNARCARCDVLGQTKLLNGICWRCYCAANGTNVELDSMPAEVKTVPLESTEPAADAGPSCDFCLRVAQDVVKEGGTVVRGKTGAHICASCACAVAGCIGAKTAADARGMMAQAQLQAEAVAQCKAMMGRIAAANESDAVLIAAAAESLARIARGG